MHKLLFTESSQLACYAFNDYYIEIIDMRRKLNAHQSLEIGD